MDHRKIILESMAISGGGNLKRSASELALYELFASEDDDKAQEGVDQIFGASEAPDSGSFAAQNGDNSENQNEFSGSNSLADNASLRPQYLYAEQSKFSLSIDSKVSICAGSTLAANISKGRDNQELEDSYDDEQSDDDFFGLEPEAGSCEQSKSCIDIKRFKRMVSNRESARRSRRRKQAHLEDLEKHAEQLRGENAALFRQLVDATQKFKDSATNNRVLRSDVEALRAKVKLAEDMIARGSLTSSLSHLLQNYLNIPQEYLNSNSSSISPALPSINLPHIGDNSPHNETSRPTTIGIQNVESFDNVADGVIGEIPTWESHAR